MTAVDVRLSEVDREVLHHLATTEEGSATEWYPADRGDGFELVRFAWRVEHQRARLRLVEFGLAFPPGGVRAGDGRVLVTDDGRALVDADRRSFAAWVDAQV